MAKSKNVTRAQAVAKEVIVALKDMIRDLEIFVEGRGSQARYWTLYTASWAISEKLRVIDPDYKEVVEPEVMPESHQIGRKTLALTHEPAVKRLL